MIHFFAIFSKNAGQTEFGKALRRIGVEHVIFSDGIKLSYKHRLKHLLVNLPKLAFFSARMSLASLMARPIPEYVVMGSDIEILVYSTIRWIARKNTRIVLSGFIFTERKSSFENIVRRLYYGFVLARTSVVVVHSTLERERYARMFPAVANRFRYIPWGGHIENRSRLKSIGLRNKNERFTIVSAGRSGRDYSTLYKAVSALDVELKVICDYLKITADETSKAKVQILQQCFGVAYLEEIARADLIVIPLAVENISAGQMVLIQAMALGKAIIVSDTPTVRDYVTDRHDAWLVKARDTIALRDAITFLMANHKLMTTLGENASMTYDRNYNNEAHLRKLIDALS